MFRYIALSLLFACVNAGYIGAPFAYSSPVVAAPALVKAAVPVATSYQNTYKISSGAVAYAAPVVKAAPVLAASPIAYAHSVAPVAPVLKSYVHGPVVAAPVVAAAPIAYSSYAAPAVVKSTYPAYPW